jgi:hypothetical protein
VILWNVRVALRKKIILTAVFSATVIVMAVAVIRVVSVNSVHQNIELAWLHFWTFVENGVGKSCTPYPAQADANPSQR